MTRLTRTAAWLLSVAAAATPAVRAGGGGTTAAEAPATASDRLVIVADGRTDYEIVVDESAFATTRLAAAELRDYLRRATGVTLRIVPRPSAGIGHIYIASTDELAPHGFAIQAHEGNLFIRGGDSAGGGRSVDYMEPIHRGTCNAVYEFLETFVGVRWYWTDRLGEIVPRSTRVAVPANLVIKQAPRFDYRVLAYGPRGSRKGDWARHNRLGAAHTVYHGHALHKIVPVDVWARRGHPEYAAMRAGTRRTRAARGSSGGHVCTGNPDVIRIVAESAESFFAGHPEQTMYSIAPPDGSGVCTCELCTRYDVPGYKVPDGLHKGWPVITDRMLHFYNSVAEIVARDYPDRRLGGTIYMDYLYPPRRVTHVHPMVTLVVAPNRALNAGNDATFSFLRELYTRWGKFHDPVYAYDTFFLSRRTFGLPTPLGHRAAELIGVFDDAGIDGAYLYIGPTWETLGAEPYLLARLLWDPGCDVDAIEREYYGLLYQSAAGAVRSYFETAEQCWRIATTADERDVRRLAGAFHRSKPWARPAFAKLILGYEPRLGDLERHLQDAERLAAGNDVLRRRVARLRDNYDLTAATIDGLRALVAYWKDRPKDAGQLVRLRRAIERRESLLRRVAKGYAPELKERLHFADAGVDSPLEYGGYYHKQAGR